MIHDDELLEGHKPDFWDHVTVFALKLAVAGAVALTTLALRSLL